MASPSDAATKLLYGTGVGMLLVAGFGLIEGRMVIDEISLGWVFAIFGLILLGLGKTLERGSGPLSTPFQVKRHRSCQTGFGKTSMHQFKTQVSVLLGQNSKQMSLN